jgi:serine/threonine protein kinase
MEGLSQRLLYVQVYKAQYLHCDVAVKKLNRTNDKKSDNAFRREAGLLKGCRNPYIVNFMGVCKDEVQRPSLFQSQPLPVPEPWTHLEVK